MRTRSADAGLAVVLLSGGIDSSTTLAMAKAEGFRLYALTFDYSQRHMRELESAGRVAAAVGVAEHLVVKVDLRAIGGSALTSDIKVPRKGALRRISAHETSNPEPLSPPLSHIPVTYVPARNTIFLSFALAWAEVLQAPDIFIGATAVDYSGYPDCRPEYLRAFEHMANLATKVSVEDDLRFRLRAPLLHLKKADIIRAGRDLGLDYSLTWSCYDPQPRGDRGSRGVDPSATSRLAPCGSCDSCRLRAKGFREAGISDPAMD